MAAAAAVAASLVGGDDEEEDTAEEGVSSGMSTDSASALSSLSPSFVWEWDWDAAGVGKQTQLLNYFFLLYIKKCIAFGLQYFINLIIIIKPSTLQFYRRCP